MWKKSGQAVRLLVWKHTNKEAKSERSGSEELSSGDGRCEIDLDG